MIKIISIVSALFNCAILIFLIGLFRGIDEGLNEGSGFSIAGETGNQFLVRYYFAVGFGLIIFVLGSFIKNSYISISIRFSSLVLAIYFYWHIYAQKSYVYNELHYATAILNESLRYDIAVVTIILLLFCLQFVELFRRIYSKTKDLV